MCAVRVEKAAAVGAELLNDFLRRDRALSDGLVGDCIHDLLALSLKDGLSRCIHFGDLHWLDKLCRVVRTKVLNYTLRNQYERTDNTDRQEYPKIAADQVNPEIPDGLHLATGNATNEGDRQHNPNGSRHEVVISQTCHLHEVAHGGFAPIVLPVGVGGE